MKSKVTENTLKESISHMVTRDKVTFIEALTVAEIERLQSTSRVLESAKSARTKVKDRIKQAFEGLGDAEIFGNYVLWGVNGNNFKSLDKGVVDSLNSIDASVKKAWEARRDIERKIAASHGFAKCTDDLFYRFDIVGGFIVFSTF